MAPRSRSPRPKITNEKAAPRKPGFSKGDPNINRTIPGPGRPLKKNSFKAFARRQLMSPRTFRSVRKILRDPTHPQFNSILNTLATYTHAKPAAKVKHSGTLTLQEILAKSREFDDE